MKRSAKPGLAAFIGLFLALSILPSAGMLAAPTTRAVGNEQLALWPQLHTADGGWNRAYLSEVSDYLADHIAFRHSFATLYARLCSGVFGTLPGEDVVLGREGWLYYAETLPDYQGTARLTRRQCWAAARALALVQEYCQGQGVDFVFTIAPNKNSIYPQYMPARYRPAASPGNASRLADCLRQQGVAYVDLFSVLRQEAGQTQLYFAWDSHWNNLGAALAADALTDALGRGPEDDRGGYSLQPSHLGDLYAMAYPAGTELEPDAVFEKGFTFTYPNGLRSAEDITIRTRNPDAGGSLLLFRDSFGNALYPFLAQRYGAACISRAMPYNLTYLEREQADTLVIELVERNLRWLVERPTRMPAPVRQVDQSWQPGDFAASAVCTEAADLEGYVEVTGRIRCPGLDPDSPIYLRGADGLVYEATPAGEGEEPFTLYLPAAAADGRLELAVRAGGVWQAAPLDLTR